MQAANSTDPQQQDRLLRLPDVLNRVCVSRAYWWSGIKAGRHPMGIKLSPRVTVWRQSDIDAFIASRGK
jgi:predicted DNA-binding transcriptional regulator AlpA